MAHSSNFAQACAHLAGPAEEMPPPAGKCSPSASLCAKTCHTLQVRVELAHSRACRAVNTQERPATTSTQVDEVDLNLRSVTQAPVSAATPCIR